MTTIHAISEAIHLEVGRIMSEEKKIIIDEDWKAQVQAEKEAAAKHSTPSDSTVAGGANPPGSAAAAENDPQMPPASFELLITSLATEALMALGQMPHPVTRELHVQRNHAQYLIDTIDVLRQKSQGNLSPGEQQLVDSVLHQLRMLFVSTANQSPAAAAK